MKGELIKAKREELGISQTELAAKCYVTKNTIWNIENDKVKPNAITLYMIKTHLGLHDTSN